MGKGFVNPPKHKGVNRESGGPLRVRESNKTIPLPQTY